MIDFGARLLEGIAAHGRLCVGVDPHPALLTRWGLPVDARGLETMARGLVGACCATSCCLKML